MTEPDATPSALLESPATVIARLPAMGRVMIITSTGAVTHERIGLVERVAGAGDRLQCLGPNHDSSFAPDLVRDLVVSRGAGPGGKVYPRIDFNTAAGETLFSVVGFEGVEPFDAALEGLRTGPAEGAPKGPAFAPRPEALETDPACAPFAAARDAGGSASVTIERPGFRQSWAGVVPAPKLAMGFVNVMVEDFHLHIAGGAVHGWEAEGTTRRALGADGAELGLSVTPAP